MARSVSLRRLNPGQHCFVELKLGHEKLLLGCSVAVLGVSSCGLNPVSLEAGAAGINLEIEKFPERLGPSVSI